MSLWKTKASATAADAELGVFHHDFSIFENQKTGDAIVIEVIEEIIVFVAVRLEVNLFELCRCRGQQANGAFAQHSVDSKECVAVLEGRDLHRRQHFTVEHLARPGKLLREGGRTTKRKHDPHNDSAHCPMRVSHSKVLSHIVFHHSILWSALHSRKNKSAAAWQHLK